MAKVETSVTELKLNKLKKEQYNSIAEPSNTELYFVTDEPISYNDLSDRPNLKPVATSGSYDDLNNKPVVNGIEIDSTNKMFFGSSTTAAATAVKEVSIPSITKLEAGQIIIVQPTITSTVAGSSLKLNNFPEYAMRYNNAAITTSNASYAWNVNFPSVWLFNGTYWVFLAHGIDYNTTYSLQQLMDYGRYTAGSGQYAITSYSLLMQKPDMTWEKITSTDRSATTATTKTANTNGFFLNHIKYYYTTSTYGNGALVPINYVYSKYSAINLRYSTNCGATPGWTVGQYFYLVGTIGADGLFYLDTAQWWSNTLPSTNDGKLYIQMGHITGTYNADFLDNRPVYYHDGTKICEYKVADNKQDKLVSGTSIKTINNTSLLDSGDISTNDLLPDQTNNSGKFLTTDGTDISWASVDAFPSQSGNSGKFLMTDGSVVSWEELAAVATSGSYTDLLNKPTIEDLTTTAQQNALNSGATSTLIGKISTNESAITTINGKIPSAASSSNQLADKDFVNSTVTTLLARYITSSASGDSFATNAALLAGPYYLDGTAVATSDLHNNDYAMVMEDETHDSKPARYIWSGSQWSFQYVLNNTTFTQAQVDAMNSTITQNLVNTYNTHVADNDIHVTTTDKNTWNAKQNAITGAATTITNDNLTSNRAIISNGSGKVAVSNTTSTELGYVHGVTSSIQTQLNSKATDSNTVHKTGAETIAGYKTFTDPTTTVYLTVNPLNDSPTSKEGGEIKFVGAAGEVNAGKAMFIDRNNGKLRLFGYDSSATVHVQLEADAEHNTLYGVAPTEDTTASRQIDTVGARNTKLQSYQPLLTAGTGIEIDGTNTINIIQLDKTYTEIGSLTQSSEGVYSNFGPNAYVRLALGFTDDFSNGSGIFRVKTRNSLAGIQPILCDTATTQRVIGVVDGVPTFYNVENIVQLSATPLSTNTWYWFAITADENGDIYYSCIVDNNYTIETLPPFSQWTIYTFMLHDDFLAVLANTSLQVGKDFWNHVWLGEVDLKDSVAIVDNVPVWGYVDLGTVPAKASVDKFGLVRPDDTTITINDGIISYKNTNGYWTGDDVQNYRNKYITNCVTTLPDNIKLELKTVDNVNTLVLKAGSKIYVPNGTNIYNEVSVESDRSYTINSSGQAFVYTNATGTMVSVMGLGRCSSGDTDSLAGTAWHIWYDTANNVIKKYDNDASTVAYTCAFPLALVTISGTSLTIDRIFNGIGFIGSKVFATPGVTVLIPNGRNEDGTLINIEKTTTNVSTYTAFNDDFVINYNGTIAEVFNVKYKEGETLPTDLVSGFWYNTRENKVYRVTNNVIGNQEKVAICCHITTDGNQKATNIDYKYPFRGTDYYDFKNLESKVDTNDSNVVHKTGTETIAGTKTFTYYAKLASGTIFTKQGGQPSIEGGEFHFEKGDSDTTIYDYVVEDLYGGKVRFFASCNLDGGGTEVRHPLIVNFTNNRIDTPSVYINGTLQNDTGTTSKLVPTIGWVNDTTAGVNNIVHKNGSETITGIKTFTENVYSKNVSYALFDNTSSSKYINFLDKNGRNSGWVENRINHDSITGESVLRLFAQTWTDNTFTTTKSANIDVVIKPDGTSYATAPTPVAGDSTIKIATTEWVANPAKSTNVVHRSGNESIDGVKEFKQVLRVRYPEPTAAVINSGLTDTIDTSTPRTNTTSLYFGCEAQHHTELGYLRHVFKTSSTNVNYSRMEMIAVDPIHTNGSGERLNAYLYLETDGVNMTASLNFDPQLNSDNHHLATTHWTRLYVSSATDGITIESNASGKLQAIGTKNKNTESSATVNIYDWVGTNEEYEAQDIATTHPEWICYITDDVEGGESVYTRTEQDVLLAQKADLNLVNSTAITNCVTKVAHDLLVDFNTETKVLTIKSGSKLYIPNGFEQDGTTLHFDIVTLDEDKTLTNSFTGTYDDILVCWDVTNNQLRQTPTHNANPTDPSSASNRFWYDTVNNKIKYYEASGTTVTSDSVSLPICRMSNTGSSGFTSLLDVFNGAGYIGTRAYILPGLQGLIPDGRNADRSLRNRKFTVNNVLIMQTSPSEVQDITRPFMHFTTNGTNPANSSVLTYDADNNYLRVRTTNDIYPLAIIGTFRRINGRISNFTHKTEFRAADYNDLVNMSTYMMPAYNMQVTGTYTSGQWIKVEKNSYVVCWGGDPYTENYYVYVSPTGTTDAQYIVGYRYDDTNAQTQITSFGFFVPAGWYFRNTNESGGSYRIYPVRGVI